MKRAIITIGFLVLMVCGQTSSGVNKYFYSSGQILPGEVWDNVYIYNDNTVVDMLGGQVSRLNTYDVSTFNMSDGQIVTSSYYYSYITIGTESTANISEGVIDLLSDFVVYGICNISGGSVTANLLKTYQDSSVEFTGGDLSFNIFEIHGESTIKSGSLHVNDAYISSWYGYPVTINVYGYSFNYNPTGGTYGDGILTGYLLDNNFFSIDRLSASEFQYFNLIPEPATMLLIGLGAMFIKKRK